MGLPSEVGVPDLWDTTVPVISGTCTDAVYSSLPHHGPWKKVSVPVLHKHLLFHKHVREARVWVKVEDEDKAQRPGLQGPRGVSTPLYLKVSD